MRLTESPVVGDAATLSQRLREHAQKVNQIANGTAAGFDGALTAPPTSGSWAVGDFVRNSAPVEAGAATTKYVVLGWIRLTNGSNNVLNTDWFQLRCLTGN